MSVTISETDDGRMWRIGGERFIDIGAVLSYLEEIKHSHSGAVLLNGAPTNYEFAALARELDRAGYTTSFANTPAPTASDTAAELAALRDENARLRETCEKALAIIDEQTPALTGWRAREMAERVRSALRGGDQICPECGMRHTPHANTLCSS